MANDPVIRLPLNPEDEVSSDEGRSFEKLRHLILAPEQEDLARLRERVENPDKRASDLSAVLPEAIQLRREQGGEDALGRRWRPPSKPRCVNRYARIPRRSLTRCSP